MKACSVNILLVGFVLLVFGVQEGCSQSGLAGFSAFLLAIISGFLLGNLTLTTVILFLMAVTPQESLAMHKRGIRSIQSELVQHLPETKNDSLGVQSRKLDGRFLQNLIAQDPLNCLPQLLCSTASSSPSTREDIINDYQFLMKEVLKQAADQADGKEISGYHNIFTKLENVNNDEGDDHDKDSDEKESDEELDKVFDLMALKEKSEMEDQMYSELVEEDPENLGFVMADINESRKWNKIRKQRITTRKPAVLYDEDLMKVVQDPDLKMLFDRFKTRVSRNLDTFREKLEANIDAQSRNPRMEKLAFFSRKQRELREAKSTDEKFRIASDVGLKYRSSRQCRRLFNTCPFQPNTLSRLVNNLRKVLTGTPPQSGQQTGSLTNNGKGSNSILSASTEPGTNVQVVVNLGSEFGGGLGNQGAPVTSAPVQAYHNPLAPAYQQQQQPLLHIPISVPHAFNTKAPNQIPTPTPAVNYQNFMNSLIIPSTTPDPESKVLQYLQWESSPTKYQAPSFQTFSQDWKTTPVPTTVPTFKTVKPTFTPAKNNDSDSVITKPFLENFLNFFNYTTTAKPEITFHTAQPINTNRLPSKESQKTKPKPEENFGYSSFARPIVHQTSTTTEKGYLLPVGFDVDPGTRTISSTSTSTEFVTTTISEGLQEDGTWMPLEHIFTHPKEGQGDEFVLHRQPPKNVTPTSQANKEPDVIATVSQVPHHISSIPIPVISEKVKSPQRIAAEAFLKQIMNGQHTLFKSSTTTEVPKILTQYANKLKPISALTPGDYLKELETALKLPNQNHKKTTDNIKASLNFPTVGITEAEQRESEELLSFIRNIDKEKLRDGTVKQQKLNQYVQVSEAAVDPDPDMKEIDEVIKLLDEQSKEESDEEDEQVFGKRPGKPKRNKIKSKNKSNKNSSPQPTPSTTSTTTTTRAPGIITDMNEVISLLNNEEKPKSKLSRSRTTKGNRKNSKVTRTKKRKPKPSSEESSEEEEDVINELPESFINRYRQIQLSRPLIAVPYRRQDSEDSDEDDTAPEPPSPVQALTSGVYSFLFSGMSTKNIKMAKPPMQRYLPLQQKHSFRNQYEDEDERPYIPQYNQQRAPEFRHERRVASHFPEYRRHPSLRPNRFYQ